MFTYYQKGEKKCLGEQVLVLIMTLPVPLWDKCLSFLICEMHHFSSFFDSIHP